MGALLSFLFSTFHHRPAVLFAEKTAPIVLSNIKSEDNKTTTLRRFVEDKCPSLFKQINPPWYLFNGHAQTLYTVVGDFTKVDEVTYERRLLRLKDGGTIGLDFTPPTGKRAFEDDTPVLVCLHGLTGGSTEAYARAIVAPVTKPAYQGGLGYRAVVMNFRGCAGTPVTSPQLYSAGHTDDIRQALWYVRKMYPRAPLVGLGFSLGANVLCRYLAEEGINSRLVSGCLLSCPWDLVKNDLRLEGQWLNRSIYSAALGSNLTNLVKIHESEFKQFPEHDWVRTIPEILNPHSKRFMRSAMEDIVSKVGGSSPPFPFATAHEYYVWGSSHHVLKDVRVPLLAINAGDDPIVQDLPDGVENPHVALIVTANGGHMGWFEKDAQGELQRWFKRPVMEWLRATAEDILLQEKPLPELYEEDGWLVEKGWENLGIKDSGIEAKVLGAENSGMLQGL